jgi:hypothetical protein
MQMADSGVATHLVEEPARRPLELTEQVEATRQAMRHFLLTRCLVQIVLVELVLFGLLGLADWLWILGPTPRATGLVVGVAAALFLLVRWGIASARHFGKQEAAAEIEATFPNLGQRVRTTLEYAEPTPSTVPAWPTLVNALTQETAQRTRGLNLKQIIPVKSLIGFGALAATVLLTYLCLLIAQPELRITALRLLLLPANYSDLAVEPGEVTLKAGETLTLRATVTGRAVHRLDLLYRPANSQEGWTRIPLHPDPLPATGLRGTLETSLADCQQNLEYRVVAGPRESHVYHVTVLHPLVLQKLEATIEPPAYTHRPTVQAKEGNFQVITGSNVQFHIALDRMPQTAQLRLYPGRAKEAGAALAPQPLQIQDNQLSGQLVGLDKDLEYEVFAEAEPGVRLEASRFRIHVLPDRKPTIRFVRPEEQIEVTPTTEVHLRLDAADDFGLSKVGIVYQIGAGPPQTLDLQAYAHQDQFKQKLPLKEVIEKTLSLEEHQLNFQDSITYYAFAEDNHPTQPQRTTTELQFIDIRPYKRQYQLLDTGGT